MEPKVEENNSNEQKDEQPKTSYIGMSLDDIIKMRNTQKKGFNSKRNFQSGNTKFNNQKKNYDSRRIYENRKPRLNNPYKNFQRKPNSKLFNKFDNPKLTVKIEENKTRLIVTNLHKEVTDAELKELFEQMGKVKRCGIHYDDSGKSKGEADVEYEKSEDAYKAIEYLNYAEVEGEIMTVKFA